MPATLANASRSDAVHSTAVAASLALIGLIVDKSVPVLFVMRKLGAKVAQS